MAGRCKALADWEVRELLARYKGGARVQWLADYYRLTRRSVYKLLADERARK